MSIYRNGPLHVLLICLIAFSGCISQKDVAKIIKDNPKIIIDTIEENPVEFVEVFQRAIKKAQMELAKKREQEERKELELYYEKPLTPKIDKNIGYWGSNNGPIVLVEYSDFQCPFCARGFRTVKSLLEEYPGKIKFVYKHLPLSFHPQALISAKYFEAIKLQDTKKAFKFHDVLYENQQKIKEGEPYLKKVAKKLGVNIKKLLKDIDSEQVKSRIADDEKEASAFGISGTPGFVINGIPVKGAYPKAHFVEIINKLKEKGKISL